MRLTNQFAPSVNPSISVYGSLAFVVWRGDRDENSEIYFKRSVDGGSTWKQDKRLTERCF